MLCCHGSFLQVAKKCFIPALFGHGAEDIFIQPHHSDRICNTYAVSRSSCCSCFCARAFPFSLVYSGCENLLSQDCTDHMGFVVVIGDEQVLVECYVSVLWLLKHLKGWSLVVAQGDKNIIKFGGDHNSPRPQFYYDSITIFFYNVLRPPDEPTAVEPPVDPLLFDDTIDIDDDVDEVRHSFLVLHLAARASYYKFDWEHGIWHLTSAWKIISMILKFSSGNRSLFLL